MKKVYIPSRLLLTEHSICKKYIRYVIIRQIVIKKQSKLTHVAINFPELLHHKLPNSNAFSLSEREFFLAKRTQKCECQVIDIFNENFVEKVIKYQHAHVNLMTVHSVRFPRKSGNTKDLSSR